MTRSMTLRTTARLLSGLPSRQDEEVPVTITWARAVPFQLAACFHDGQHDTDVTWFLSRDLPCAAYANPETVYGDGDVQCCLSGRSLVVRVAVPPSSAIFGLDAEEVAEFLERTLEESPVEQGVAERRIDEVISSILDEAGA